MQSSMHYLRLPLDKLFVNLFVDPIKPLFGAVRPIAAGSEFILQLRDVIPGGAQLACNLLRRFTTSWVYSSVIPTALPISRRIE